MKSADEWFDAGMAHLQLAWSADHHSELAGDLEDAVAHFDRALALRPEHAEAWAQKGLALARLDRHEEAAVALGEALRLRPGETELWLKRSGCLASLGRHVEALAACDEVLRRRPDDVEAWFRKAQMLDALRLTVDALAAWDEALRRLSFSERRFRALLARAGALERLGRRGEAGAAFQEAIEAGGRLHPMSGLHSTTFQEALREFEEARAAYHEHIQSKAGEPGTWRSAGRAFLGAKRTQESLAAYEELIRLVPDDADAWWGKAEALVQAGRREEAVPVYQEALRLRPGHLGISARLGVVLKELGGAKGRHG